MRRAGRCILTPGKARSLRPYEHSARAAAGYLKEKPRWLCSADVTGCFALLAASTLARPAIAAEKIRVLIVDGQNNHNWKAMTPPMKADLEAVRAGSPSTWRRRPTQKAPKDAWDAFHPDFSKYDVVLSNYNGEPWPDGVQKALESYVADGRRAVDHPRGQ